MPPSALLMFCIHACWWKFLCCAAHITINTSSASSAVLEPNSDLFLPDTPIVHNCFKISLVLSIVFIWYSSRFLIFSSVKQDLILYRTSRQKVTEFGERGGDRMRNDKARKWTLIVALCWFIGCRSDLFQRLEHCYHQSKFAEIFISECALLQLKWLILI